MNIKPADSRYDRGTSGGQVIAGTALRLKVLDGQRLVAGADGSVMGELQAVLNPAHRGLLRTQVSADANKVDITYFGPDDLWLA